MHQSYKDIISRISEPPLWWDEHGVPRYDPFTPQLVNDIYADEVALLLIACQHCGRRFPVALSSSLIQRLLNEYPSLTESLAEHAYLGYGDPPNFGCCPAGPTMSSEPLQVLEFWIKERSEWVRKEDREIVFENEEES